MECTKLLTIIFVYGCKGITDPGEFYGFRANIWRVSTRRPAFVNNSKHQDAHENSVARADAGKSIARADAEE
jgi:hypothetical protein